MSDLAVIVPVLARPWNVGPLVASLAASGADCRLVFVCSPDDREQIDACEQTGADVAVVSWQPERGDWARKIQYAYDHLDERFLFQGGDDISFEPGWDTELLRTIDETGTGICGSNDGANPAVKAGKHATHSLIRRAYIDECGGSLEGPGTVFSPAYDHNFAEVETVEIAKTDRKSVV